MSRHSRRPGGFAASLLLLAGLSLPAVLSPAACAQQGGKRQPAAKPTPKVAAGARAGAPQAGKAVIGHWVYASGISVYQGKAASAPVSGDFILGTDGKFSYNRYIGRIAGSASGAYTVRGNQLVLKKADGQEVWTFRIQKIKDPNGKIGEHLLLETEGLSYGLTRKVE